MYLFLIITSLLTLGAINHTLSLGFFSSVIALSFFAAFTNSLLTVSNSNITATARLGFKPDLRARVVETRTVSKTVKFTTSSTYDFSWIRRPLP